MEHKTRTGMLRMLFGTAILLLTMVSLLLTVHAGDVDGATAAIIAGCQAEETKIELEKYGMTAEEVEEVFADARNSGALPWYVCADFLISYYEEDGGWVAVSLQPTYLDKTIYNRTRYEQAVAEVLDQCVHPGMSDWQIALSLHDYLASHIRYDMSLVRNTGYEALVEGTAVCQGYSEAYLDLLTRCGIPCRIVNSEAMEHAWNLVQIDGQWYHVDITWDDPAEDCYGRIMHDYFLVSDIAVSDEDHKHYGWISDEICTSTELDADCFWHDVNSGICYLDAYTSVIRYDEESRSTIYRRDEQTGELTELDSFDIGTVRIAGDGLSWWYGIHGLTLWNGTLYYSDLEHVYAMQPDGSGKTTVYTHDAEANGTFVAGSYVSNGTLYVSLSDHDGVMKPMSVTLGVGDYHAHLYQETVIPPTCTEAGYTEYRCACGVSYTGETELPAGHSYDMGTVDAARPNIRRYTCANCGDTYTEETSLDSGNQGIGGVLDAIGDGASKLEDSIRNPQGSKLKQWLERDDVKAKLLAVVIIVALPRLFRRKKR